MPSWAIALLGFTGVGILGSIGYAIARKERRNGLIIISPKGWCAEYHKATGALLVSAPRIVQGTKQQCFAEDEIELGRFPNYTEAKRFFDTWESERGPPEVL